MSAAAVVSPGVAGGKRSLFDARAKFADLTSQWPHACAWKAQLPDVIVHEGGGEDLGQEE